MNSRHHGVPALQLAALVAALTGTLVMPHTSHAQRIGLGVGTLVPQGELADGAETGLAAIAALEFGSKTALRIEALWANSELKGAIITSANGVPVPPGANISGDVRVIGGIASVVLHLTDGPLQPYLLGGAGYYNRSVAQDAADAASEFRDLSLKESKVGVHFGIGLKFRVIGISAFGEARYHAVNTDESKTNFVPLIVGIRL
jgi:hypothetical protein